ncbi:MAG: anthranilate phosphoribosyltransferase, partial [Tumebacillaceae bacterium]
IGAFFIAERVKSETPEELLAFVEVGREKSTRIAHGRQGLLDCAGPYDGRAKSFAATIPVAMVLAAAGVPVALHGSDTLPPKFGTSLHSILQELQVPVGTTVEQVSGQIEEHGVTFVETETFCPPLHKLRQIRLDLGVRTLLNTAEKFLNLACGDFLVAGVFHTTAMDKAAELMLRLGYRKGMVVQGIDGSEDVPTNRPSAICIVQNGTIEKLRIDPKDYGLDGEMETVPRDAQEQALFVERVLKGDAPEFFNMVIVNSALRLWLIERVDTIEQGVELAREMLTSGKAWEKFVEWRCV